jgi:hypothetical protein
MERSILFVPSLGTFDQETLESLVLAFPKSWEVSTFKEPLDQIFLASELQLPKLLLIRKQFLTEYFSNNKFNLLVVTQIFHPATVQLIEVAKQAGIPIVFIVPEIMPTGERVVSASQFFKEQELETLKELGLLKAPPLDFICTWSSSQAESFRLKDSTAKVFITGHPILDKFKPKEVDGKVVYDSVETKHSLLLKLGLPEGSRLVSYYIDFFDKKSRIISRLDNLNELLKDTNTYIYVRNYSKHSLKLTELKNIIVDNDLDNQHQINFIDGIRLADGFVSGHTEHLVYSILLGKVPVIYDSAGLDPLGLVKEGGVALVKTVEELSTLLLKNSLNTKQDLTPQQLNYFLLNFLPCTLDSSNSRRVTLVLELAMQAKDILVSQFNVMVNNFKEKFPTLSDPLAKEKEMVNRVIDGLEV